MNALINPICIHLTLLTFIRFSFFHSIHPEVLFICTKIRGSFFLPLACTMVAVPIVTICTGFCTEALRQANEGLATAMNSRMLYDQQD